jgi:hypothetical protein
MTDLQIFYIILAVIIFIIIIVGLYFLVKENTPTSDQNAFLVTLFKDCNFQGERKILEVGEYSGTILNGYKSLAVPRGFIVIIRNRETGENVRIVQSLIDCNDLNLARFDNILTIILVLEE